MLVSGNALVNATAVSWKSLAISRKSGFQPADFSRS